MKAREFAILLLKRIFLSKDSFVIFAGAAAFYLVFYAWPYWNQIITHIPTAIVDLDRSAQSRSLTSALQAAPSIDLRAVVHDMSDGDTIFRSGQVAVLIVIPENFAKDTNRAKPTAITVYSDGAYPAKGRAVYASVLAVCQAENIVNAIRYVLINGGDAQAAKRLANAGLPFVSQDLFNEIAGYGLYTVSMVVVVILQSVIFFGTAVVLGGCLQEGNANAIACAMRSNRRFIWTTLAVFSAIAFFWGLFIEGIGMWLLNMPSMGCAPSTILSLTLFSVSVSSFAIMVTFMLRGNLYAAMTFIPMSAPSVFMTGLIYPSSEFPLWAKTIAFFFPSTPGASAILFSSQQGAPAWDLVPLYFWLIVQIALFSAGIWYFSKRALKRLPN